MGYISKELMQKAYKELSSLTEDHLQGQTQIVSMLRYVFALDMFCTTNETEKCDLNISDNKTEYVHCVRRIVNIYNDYYTTNFFTTIKPLQDCGVGSNFYSAGVVNNSKQNTRRLYDYPTRGQNPLFKVQANVLIRNFDYYENISFYLNTNELKQAFAIWLLRNDDIDSLTEDSIKNALLDNYSEEIIEELIPDDSNIEDFTNGFSLEHTQPILNENDFLSLFEMMPNHTSPSSLPNQQIFYGAPGTGKSHTIKRVVEDGNLPHIRTTFHPDSDYSTFVGAYKPTTIDVPMRDVSGHIIVEGGETVIEKKIIYTFVPQAFLKAYVAAWSNLNEPFFLIIEEINRGNCAQIFGDLFQLLDRNSEGISDYPVTSDDDIRRYLNSKFSALDDSQRANIPDEILSGEKMLLPRNLHIWATMNTSDQSLFPIDSAFKRRWDWKYTPIANGNKNWKITADGKEYDWWQFLEKINAQIGNATHSEDKKLGYYFCKPINNQTIDAETFVSKVVFYLWNDVFKDFAEDAGSIFNDEDGSVLSFNKFYTTDADGNAVVVEQKVTQFLQNLGVEALQDVE